MIRTFKYPLYPSKKQSDTLTFWLEKCCELYNAALYERIDAWKKQKISVSLYNQQKSLTQIRKEHKEWKDIPVLVERSALKKLDLAFRGFFRRAKAKKEKAGFPRFKSRNRYDSFSIDKRKPKNSKVRILNLGLIKFHEYRKLKGEILEIHIKRKCGKWYIFFICNISKELEKRSIESFVGVDLGIKKFIKLSDGKEISNPGYFRKSENLLVNRQKSLLKKLKGSKSRNKAKLLVGKAHEHIHNQRLDFARKLAKDLFTKYDLVAVEDLNINNMMNKNKQMNKNIADASWGIFINALSCKAEEAGKHLVLVNPKNTSSMCSGCGNIVHKELNERIHSCKICGLTLDRDHNAAINILALGRSAVDSTSLKSPGELLPKYNVRHTVLGG